MRAVQDQANFRNSRNGHSLNVDGRYGPKTAAWVRAFQHAIAQEIHGFPVDGIVGPLTWQALVTEALSGKAAGVSAVPDRLADQAEAPLRT